jgi:hypothetical protein
MPARLPEGLANARRVSRTAAIGQVDAESNAEYNDRAGAVPKDAQSAITCDLWNGNYASNGNARLDQKAVSKPMNLDDK